MTALKTLMIAAAAVAAIVVAGLAVLRKIDEMLAGWDDDYQ